MSWNLIVDDWRMKLLALGLAVLMLGAVAFSQNPPTTERLTVGLNYTVPPDLILLNAPVKMTVTFSGLADVIKNVNTSNLVASVDATHAAPGTAVRLNVVARSLINGVAVQNPPPIAVNIDTRRVKELEVQVITRVAPGWSLTKPAVATCGGAPNTPCTVHFDGPASWETNLIATASLPGVVSFNTIDSPNQPIRLQNSSGDVNVTNSGTVPPASLDVTAVSIHVEAKAGSTSSSVALVDSPPASPPPPGYRVTGVTINPITVIISGDPAVLGRILRITLPPIDLSGHTSDFTAQVTIPYPNGVTGSVGTAALKYSISRNPNVTPSP